MVAAKTGPATRAAACNNIYCASRFSREALFPPMPHLFHRSHSPGDTASRNRFYAWFPALHTRVDLLLLAPLSEAEFEIVEEAVQQELIAVEQMGNRFNPASELSQAMYVAAVHPAPISSELYSLLARCLQANRETGGLFDITVNTPDFSPGFINAVELTPPPSSTSFSPVMATVPGAFPSGQFYLRLHRPSLILDLSGILKGYALERLRTQLPRFGITDALISLGNSSILSLGNNPSDIPPGHCLTTSGNSTPDRCHIRHPLTGQFVKGQRQTSVITDNGIDGEILSIVRFLQET